MIITTTNSIQGREITQYLGVITDFIYAKIYDTKGLSFRDSLNRDKIYERSEEGIDAAKQEVLKKLEAKAKEMGAHAIVGITMDVEVIIENSKLGISAMGTAVVLR
ncbi:YbjQ family protein [uncultured Dokdonia sp.]|uniref:YbjQ family protein n=1 Tax=Dokdonia sp. R78006 TaxID=3093866 RepID=UPI0026103BEB|nr:heavy metal-binding domain-containing protein [uncultured Dokdonia sp.]